MDDAGTVAVAGRPGATKLRILALLRRTPHTVTELARELGLTSNAVRTHLAALERDRLVAPQGQRPTARRPATTYKSTPLADQLFTKPYAAVLSAVLQRLKDRYGESELTSLLRAIGRQLGQERALRVSGLSDRTRVEALAEVIKELGGVAEIEEHDGRFTLVGYSCPLAAIVADHVQVCALTQSLLETVLGQGEVHECCECRGEIRCRFAIDLHASSPAPEILGSPHRSST